MPEQTWLLVEKLATRKSGAPVWFSRMTPIGPASTQERSEAAEFASQQAAYQSPAYAHSLSFYEPTLEGGER